MPRLYVPAPSVAALPYGLLSVVQARFDEPDPHWQSGVQWQPLCGSAGSTYDPCLAVTGVGGPPPSPDPKTAGVTDETRGATPWAVYAGFDCSPAAWASEAAAKGEQALARMESWAVERSFWSGVSGGETVAFPHLAADADVSDVYGVLLQTAAVPVTGAVLDIVEALGRVEQALADCYKGVGVIHIPAVLGPALDANFLTRKVGAQLRTLNGNLIALGSGYPGTAPDGTVPAAGTTWIYGTGAVFAYRSPVTSMPRDSIVNRANNDVNAIAERTWVIGYDCCLIAALVSTGGVEAGAANSSGGQP